MGEGDDAGDGHRPSGLDLASMRKIAIFEQCSDRFVQELLAEMRVETFAAGDVLFKEGDVGNCMYFVQRGKLDIMVKEKKVATLNEGNHVGEMALLGGKKRTATVIAAADCEMNVIDRKPFQQVLARSPKEAAIFKGEALRRKSGLKNMRQSIAVSKVLGQNLAQSLAGSGSGKKAYKMMEHSTAQEKNLRICFDAHSGKSGKVYVHDDPDADGEMTEEGERFKGTLHSFGMTRYRPGGKMGAGQGLLEREIEELMEECEDDDVDFIEVKTLASRESYLAQEWKSYHEVRVQEGQVGEDMLDSSSEPWLDPMWQIKESFKILTNSVGDGQGLEIAMLYQVLNTCGEEMDNEEFDEFLQLTKLENTGNVKVDQILSSLREYSYADPYEDHDDEDEPAAREKAPAVPGGALPASINKREILKEAGANMRGGSD